MSILRFIGLGASEGKKNREKQKKRMVVLYQSKDSKLPLGIIAIKGKIVGYRCGKGEPCHLDGKECEKISKKMGRKKCSACEYIEVLIEIDGERSAFEERRKIMS